MIQRKQTIYLFSLILLSTALFFVPSAKAIGETFNIPIYLLPLEGENILPSLGHVAATWINLVSLLGALICIFMYNKRNAQLKLSYGLMILWLFITLILSSLPLTLPQDGLVIENTNYGTLLGVFGMLGAYMSARLIKKDIELLKSADRIR